MPDLPTTAAGWVEYHAETAQKAWDQTWKDGGLPAPAEHMHLTTMLVHGVIEAMLWESLRLAAPEAADKLAEDVESLCESGDSFGELLYEWRERLAAGLPISGNPTYQDVFQRVGLTS
jgi:hypothetical protein